MDRSNWGLRWVGIVFLMLLTCGRSAAQCGPSNACPAVTAVDLYGIPNVPNTTIPLFFGGEGAEIALDATHQFLYFGENPFDHGFAAVVQLDLTGSQGPVTLQPPGGFGDVTALTFYGGKLYVADGNGYQNLNAAGQPTPLNVIWQYDPANTATNGGWSQITGVSVNDPTGLAFDAAQNLYVSSWTDRTVYKYPYDLASGLYDIPRIAFWIVPDPTAAPYSLAFDQPGNLYIAGFGGGSASTGTKIFKVDPSGNSSIFFDAQAADPQSMYFNDGGSWQVPTALAFDTHGYLYTSYYSSLKIVRIAPDGSFIVVPGGGTADDAANGIAISAQGDLFTVVNGGRTTASPAVLKIDGLVPVPPAVSLTVPQSTEVYQSTFSVSAVTNASTIATITATGACTISGNSVTMISGTGTCTLTASWPADTNYIAATTTQIITAASAASTITLNSSFNPSLLGQSVTFTAMVSSAIPGTPTGSVTFYDGGTALGSSALSGAQFTTTGLSLGTHSITAAYSGDANYAGSASPGILQSVASSLPSVALVAVSETIHTSDSESIPDIADSEAIKASDMATVTPLINVAAPVVSFSAGSLGFGSVPAGQTGTQLLSVSDIGQAPLIISSSALAQGSAFAISQISCSNGATSLPTTLPVGGACTFVVSYSAPAGAAASDTMTFTDNAALSNLVSVQAGSSYTQSIALNGSGASTPPPPPPPAVVSIAENETVNVSDTTSFEDVAESEGVHVSDLVSVQVLNTTITSIAVSGTTFGSATTATVSVSSSTATVTGNVTLSIDGGTATTMALSNGSATFNLGNLALGNHTLVASFAAQGAFLASSVQTVFAITSTTPTIASISPNSGAQGTVVNVTITGTNLAAATAVNVSGGGITVSNFVAVSATTTTVTFTIAPNAALSARNATVTTPAGRTNAATFTVIAPPAPTLTSIAPAFELRGMSQAVTLTGTNFVNGATVVATPAVTGFSLGNVIVVSPTEITATLTSAPTAPLGDVNVDVVTAGGASNTLPFAIAGPVLTSITPTSGNRGTTGLSLALVGSGLSGATSVNFSGGGIMVTGITVNSDTSITATVNISPNAAAGAKNVTVTALGGNSNAVTFTVTVPPVGLFSITPNTGARGTAQAVTLTGISFQTGANPATGITVTGGGMTVTGFTVVNDTTITANFVITPTAALAARNVTVTTAGGRTTPVTFTVVNPGTPVLVSITPASGLRRTAAAANPVAVVLAGSNFTAGSTVNVVAPANGLTVTGVTVVSPTQIDATFNTTTTAVIGPRSISVTTPGGTSGPVTYTVLGPVLTSITPTYSLRGQGAAVPVMLFGTGLTGTTAVSLSGGGVTVGPITVVSDTQVNTTFTIGADAAGTARNVTVTAPGGVSNSVALTVVIPPTPTLVSVSLNTGVRGTPVPVTLTGSNFIANETTVAVSGTGVTVNSANVTSTTTLSATFTIAANASLGVDSVTVTVAGAAAASNSVPFTVQGPTLTSISPNSGIRGTTVPVTFTGANLTGAVGLNGLGGGVSLVAGSLTVVNSTTVTASLAISTTATVSIRNIGLTTAIGNTNTIPFTVQGATLASISPTSATHPPILAIAVPVTITGTNLTGTTALTGLGTGVTVAGGSLTSTSTTITATLTVARTATVGARAIGATTAAGATTNTVTFTVN
jgi:hypothetical protein